MSTKKQYNANGRLTIEEISPGLWQDIKDIAVDVAGIEEAETTSFDASKYGEGHVMHNVDDVQEAIDKLTDLVDNTASDDEDGLMSSSDKIKLDSIEKGANNYVHPFSHDASIIVESPSRRFVTDEEKALWNSMSAGGSSHNHDDRYYTETEIDTKLDEKFDAVQGKILGDKIGNTDQLLTEDKTSIVNAINELKNASADANGGGVGQTTNKETGAEIFNDYENNQAIGMYSHAEGFMTCAYGDVSHAEGVAENKPNIEDPTFLQYFDDVMTLGEYWGEMPGISIAYGTGSHIEGGANIAYGIGSHAEGAYNLSGGIGSHAEGVMTASIGDGSHSEGVTTFSFGEGSHTEGLYTQTNGEASHAEGNLTEANGKASHAEGYGSHSDGEASHAEGYGNLADGEASHAEGYSTTSSGEYSHAEGSGSEANGTASHAEGKNTVANGYYSHAEGFSTCAQGTGTHAEGYKSLADGFYAHAEGYETECYGYGAHAEGMGAQAYGNGAHAEGEFTLSSHRNAHAEGCETSATGNTSHVEGNHTTAETFAIHVQGQYNKVNAGNAEAYSATNNAFVIGNGTSASAKSNAFRVTFDGKTYGLSAFNSTGADYAEYFEWLDGNPNNEDRIGLFVALDGEQIRIAESEDDYIVGIISGNQSIIGNSCEDSWNDMYIRDEFGRLIYEDVEVEYVDKIETKIKEYKKEMHIQQLIEEETTNIINQTQTINLLKTKEEIKSIKDIAQANKHKVKEMLETINNRKLKNTEESVQKFNIDEINLLAKENLKEEIQKIEEEPTEVIVKTTERRIKLNPNYNPDTQYVPRSKRKEWGIVGMLGQIVVKDDGTCKVNGFCKPSKDGIATASDDKSHYRVMSRINDNLIKVLFK